MDPVRAAAKSFGRFDPATQQVEQYAIGSVDPRLASATPRMLTAAQDVTATQQLDGKRTKVVLRRTVTMKAKRGGR